MKRIQIIITSISTVRASIEYVVFTFEHGDLVDITTVIASSIRAISMCVSAKFDIELVRAAPNAGRRTTFAEITNTVEIRFPLKRMLNTTIKV